jgi:hypothetical protein
VAAIVTFNLVSDRAESLLPELAKALHVDEFDRSIPGKAMAYFSSEAAKGPELVRWAQGKITENGWDDDFVVIAPLQ